MIVKIRGELEIDQERGVVYFHAGRADTAEKYGVTPLRLCRVPRRLLKTFPTDITITGRLALAAANDYGAVDNSGS